MGTPLDRRVADALHLIAHHVLNKGFEHPEGLSIELPYYEDNVQKGTLQVHAHVNLDEWPVEQHISNNPVSDYASEVFVNDEHPINATTGFTEKEEEDLGRWEYPTTPEEAFMQANLREDLDG